MGGNCANYVVFDRKLAVMKEIIRMIQRASAKCSK